MAKADYEHLVRYGTNMVHGTRQNREVSSEPACLNQMNAWSQSPRPKFSGRKPMVIDDLASVECMHVCPRPAHNKVLHQTASPLRSIATGKLGR